MNGVYLALGEMGFGPYEFVAGVPVRRVEGWADSIAVPGFVDVHVHGGYGVDFMTSTSKEITTWLDQCAAIGVEAMLPTTVTATATEVLDAFKRCPEHPLVAGFHLEGPFISPQFPGAQPPSAIVSPPNEPGPWDEVFSHPKLRLVTLAPELPGIEPLIARLHARGVVVSMGHTNATYEEADDGFLSGVRHATHTYNAMRPLHHREAGALGYVLDQPEINAELIYDRVHVSRPAASVLFRAKGAERVVAVSDGTMAVGLPAGTKLTMWNLDCVVDERSVRLASNGALAGSTISIADAFRNLFDDFGPEVAIRACSLNPRRVLGISGVRVWQVYGESLDLREIVRL